MRIDYCISDVAPYINWIYFFHAWGVNKMPQSDRQQLQAEAEGRLQRYAGRYQTHALFQLFDAHSEGDDIVLAESGLRIVDSGLRIVESRLRMVESGLRIPCLRQQQQGSDYLCLADFICPLNYSHSTIHNPLSTIHNPQSTIHIPQSTIHNPQSTNHHPPSTKIGIFATTVDLGMETDFDADPYEKMMMQLLADRLAEATAEKMHEAVRKTYWGYAPDEQLSMADMLQERFQGIRPAVGYPSLPDTSLNFIIDQLIDMKQIGIRLTESGAMKPHASVSGLMLAHPDTRYFSVGKIGEDQLADYASRRGLPVELMRKFLGGNIR